MSGLIDNFWVLLALKVALVGALVPALLLPVVYAEIKLSAHMQSRVGPYYAGGRWGWAQPLADGIKFFQKEDLIPAAADRWVFKLAPLVVLTGAIATYVIIPIGPELRVSDLDVGVFYALAISSLSTLGVLMAGWSSGNKYSLVGGLRAAAQLIAYELPLVLAVIGVVIQAGTMSMVGIVEAQTNFHIPGTPEWLGLPFAIPQFIGFGIFLVAAVAELTRIPFDMPVAESELVMGYLTEYSGYRFLLFFLAEYASAVALSAIAATLFLGGYHAPGMPDGLAGPFVLGGKVALLVFVLIWLRWTFPRFREDQLQSLAWRWLIPAGLINIVATAAAKVVV